MRQAPDRAARPARHDQCQVQPRCPGRRRVPGPGAADRARITRIRPCGRRTPCRPSTHSGPLATWIPIRCSSLRSAYRFFRSLIDALARRPRPCQGPDWCRRSSTDEFVLLSRRMRLPVPETLQAELEQRLEETRVDRPPGKPPDPSLLTGTDTILGGRVSCRAWVIRSSAEASPCPHHEKRHSFSLRLGEPSPAILISVPARSNPSTAAISVFLLQSSPRVLYHTEGRLRLVAVRRDLL